MLKLSFLFSMGLLFLLPGACKQRGSSLSEDRSDLYRELLVWALKNSSLQVVRVDEGDDEAQLAAQPQSLQEWYRKLLLLTESDEYFPGRVISELPLSDDDLVKLLESIAKREFSCRYLSEGRCVGNLLDYFVFRTYSLKTTDWGPLVSERLVERAVQSVGEQSLDFDTQGFMDQNPFFVAVMVAGLQYKFSVVANVVKRLPTARLRQLKWTKDQLAGQEKSVSLDAVSLQLTEVLLADHFVRSESINLEIYAWLKDSFINNMAFTEREASIVRSYDKFSANSVLVCFSQGPLKIVKRMNKYRDELEFSDSQSVKIAALSADDILYTDNKVLSAQCGRSSYQITYKSRNSGLVVEQPVVKIPNPIRVVASLPFHEAKRPGLSALTIAYLMSHGYSVQSAKHMKAAKADYLNDAKQADILMPLAWNSQASAGITTTSASRMSFTKYVSTAEGRRKIELLVYVPIWGSVEEVQLDHADLTAVMCGESCKRENSLIIFTNKCSSGSAIEEWAGAYFKQAGVDGAKAMPFPIGFTSSGDLEQENVFATLSAVDRMVYALNLLAKGHDPDSVTEFFNKEVSYRREGVLAYLRNVLNLEDASPGWATCSLDTAAYYDGRALLDIILTNRQSGVTRAF